MTGMTKIGNWARPVLKWNINNGAMKNSCILPSSHSPLETLISKRACINHTHDRSFLDLSMAIHHHIGSWEGIKWQELSETGTETKYQKWRHEMFMHSSLIKLTPGNPNQPASKRAYIDHSQDRPFLKLSMEIHTTLAGEKKSSSA